jgi:hypothetical protein
MCTYTASGTLLNCNTAIPSVGTWGALNYPTWVSGTPFVKMTAAGAFSLDTNTYLTTATPLAHAIVFSDMSNTVYTASQVQGLFYAPVPGTIPAGGAGTYNAVAATSQCDLMTAATASTAFTFADGGTNFGTVVFAVSGTTGTFTISSDKAVSSGDKITVTAPATADATAAGLNCSLVFAY